MFSTLLRQRLWTRPLIPRPAQTLQRLNRPNYRLASTARFNSTTSFTDPSRPDLFYHLVTPPNASPVYALSFLSTPPKELDEPSVIGWLPSSASEGGEAGLNDFHSNQRFLQVLHKAIKSGLEEGVDEVQKNKAIQLEDGWMHIHDERNLPAPQRIGDPDDIIASVLVENSKIIAETYQSMPSYRLCTADGVLQLTEGLANKLKTALEEQVKNESSS